MNCSASCFCEAPAPPSVLTAAVPTDHLHISLLVLLSQAIWGLGPDERVLVVATCKLGGCERPGTALLSTRHLAFTTLLEDGKVAAEAAESAVTR
jgi:hypothetical protein